MEYAQKLVYQSNYWYNDGLKRAKIRDMSGAVASLKKSLQYNRENIAARNLLGLVYYGRGEVGEALVEWIISKNFRSHENIAAYYIRKVRENAAELEAMNQAIRRYNQSLVYCEQNGEDLAIIQLKKAVAAHPSFLKAYQLLALLYLHTEQYGKARQVLREAHKLDTTNDITLRYMHEMKQLRKSRTARSRREEKSQTITYQVGNETIIQPAPAGMKDSAGRATVLNIAIGILVGAAVVWFLIMPAVTRSNSAKTNRQVTEFSDRIAAQESQIGALKTELDTYRTASEEAESAKQTAESSVDSYEILMQVYSHYLANDMSDADMAGELLKINPDALGDVGKKRYEAIRSEVFERYGAALYYLAQENYSVANYADAITNLTRLMQLDEGYGDGQAMLLLADSYKAGGDSKNADIWYDRLDQNFPDVRKSEEADEEGQETQEN